MPETHECCRLWVCDCVRFCCKCVNFSEALFNDWDWFSYSMRYLAFFVMFALITPFLISDAIAVPVERVPITSFGAYSSDGKEIQEIVAGTQVNLVSNATNTLDAKQSFVYGTWISENNGTRTPIDWIETSLDAKSSSVFSIPWIPDTAGKYTVEASIWEDNETFTAFSAIWQVTLDVISKDSYEKLVPEPESEQDSPVYENCGPGTTLQNGICIVDRSQNPSANSSVKWGSGIDFTSAWQFNGAATLPIFDDFFSITEEQVRYAVFYNVTNASIRNVQLNCDESSFSFSILPEDEGTVQLDIPKGMLDGIFMVHLDGKEWDDVSLDGNVLTINFSAHATTVDVFGTYYLGDGGRDGVCDVIHDPPHSYILSPLKQDSAGISFQEIQCKPGLDLVAKMPSAEPACVKPESVEKLTMRGWASTDKSLELANPTKFIVDKNNVQFEIQYSLNGATLENIAHDADANSVHVSLSESVGGQITISIPRDLMDATIGNGDDMFFVLIDGVEYLYGEKVTDDERVVTVWFPKGAHDIEIIGTGWI